MLKKIFHLSEEGSKAVMKASLCMTIFNLATLLPIILLAMVTNEQLFWLHAGVYFSLVVFWCLAGPNGDYFSYISADIP